jgi:hypothetical protein
MRGWYLWGLLCFALIVARDVVAHRWLHVGLIAVPFAVLYAVLMWRGLRRGA